MIYKQSVQWRAERKTLSRTSLLGVTLNTYTHLDFDDIQKEMKEVFSG